MEKKKDALTEERYGELGKAFNFTKGDLEANRAGFISYRQKRNSRLRLLIYIGIVCISLCIFIWGSGILGLRTIQQIIFALIFGACFFVPSIAILASYSQQLLFDLKAGRVEAIEGEAQIITTTIKGPVWDIKADNGDVYDLRPWQIPFVKDKGRFRSYVMPRTKEIMSLEAATD